MPTLAIGGVPITIRNGYLVGEIAGGGGAITYTGPATSVQADSATVSVAVDTGAPSADRIVLLAIGGQSGGSISSVSFGGVTSYVSEGVSGDDDVWIVACAVPSGTGNQTCTVVFGSTMFYPVVGAYVIRGAQLPPSDGDAVVDTDFPFAPTIPLVIPEGGAVFSLGSMNLGTSATLSIGATTLTDTEVSNTVNRTVHFGDATDLTAASANWSQDSSLCFAAAAVVFTPG